VPHKAAAAAAEKLQSNSSLPLSLVTVIHTLLIRQRITIWFDNSNQEPRNYIKAYLTLFRASRALLHIHLLLYLPCASQRGVQNPGMIHSQLLIPFRIWIISMRIFMLSCPSVMIPDQYVCNITQSKLLTVVQLKSPTWQWRSSPMGWSSTCSCRMHPALMKIPCSSRILKPDPAVQLVRFSQPPVFTIV
jgi:hypothetical protein